MYSVNTAMIYLLCGFFFSFAIRHVFLNSRKSQCFFKISWTDVFSRVCSAVDQSKSHSFALGL